jgi:hypothetical protein
MDCSASSAVCVRLVYLPNFGLDDFLCEHFVTYNIRANSDRLTRGNS